MSKAPEQGGTPQGIQKLGQPANSKIQHVVAVMSGKGGVGKSSVTALLAAELARLGRKVGILDADVTGPSIPRLFGLKGNAITIENQMLPETTGLGIRVMSLNLLLDREDEPVIWRGPLIAGAVRQFWSDVLWGDIDYMVVDLPPGTGDAPLTVLQSLPVGGAVIVTTPQDLSKMVVAKAVNMVRTMRTPIIGLIENMAWIRCPHCGNKIEPFGHANPEETAKRMGLTLLGSLPLDPRLSEMGDAGAIEQYGSGTISAIVELIEKSTGPGAGLDAKGR